MWYVCASGKSGVGIWGWTAPRHGTTSRLFLDQREEQLWSLDCWDAKRNMWEMIQKCLYGASKDVQGISWLSLIRLEYLYEIHALPEKDESTL